MKNIDFLTKILMSKDEYWIVAKANSGCHGETFNDSILLIVIPYNVKRGLLRDDIKLIDLENLQNTKIEGNIFLNETYPPFQSGQTFYNIYDGFSIKRYSHDILINAVKLGSSDIWDYKKLIKESEK